jgi:hypothetical protein
VRVAQLRAGEREREPVRAEAFAITTWALATLRKLRDRTARSGEGPVIRSPEMAVAGMGVVSVLVIAAAIADALIAG